MSSAKSTPPKRQSWSRTLAATPTASTTATCKTFEVRLETSLELVEKLPPNAVHVAESGIHTAADIQTLRSAGFDAFLIGESLMRHPSPGAALEDLLKAANAAPEPTAQHT